MARLLVFTTLVLALASRVASADVTYEVLNESKLPRIERSLDVRLSGRTDETDLRDIALKLKALDSAYYKRTFIMYYLPPPAPGSIPWATSHFNPKLEVKILGMRREQEANLASRATSPVLGTWASRGIMAAVVTIERSSKGLLMRQRFKDGSESRTLLKETHEPKHGKQYHYKAGSSFGEHVRINQAGDLEFWDHEGLITTAKKR